MPGKTFFVLFHTIGREEGGGGGGQVNVHIVME